MFNPDRPLGEYFWPRLHLIWFDLICGFSHSPFWRCKVGTMFGHHLRKPNFERSKWRRICTPKGAATKTNVPRACNCYFSFDVWVWVVHVQFCCIISCPPVWEQNLFRFWRFQFVGPGEANRSIWVWFCQIYQIGTSKIGTTFGPKCLKRSRRCDFWRFRSASKRSRFGLGVHIRFGWSITKIQDFQFWSTP